MSQEIELYQAPLLLDFDPCPYKTVDTTSRYHHNFSGPAHVTKIFEFDWYYKLWRRGRTHPALMEKKKKKIMYQYTSKCKDALPC